MGHKGFTLIELLIVIAIIGILAGTVVVSLSGETDAAQDSSTELAVTSLRPAALRSELKKRVPVISGITVCNEIHAKVKGGKDHLDTWDPSQTKKICKRKEADVLGEICCNASGVKWAVWGKLSDEASPYDIYCTDHTGFTGSVDLDASGGTNLEAGSGNALKDYKCE